MKHRHLQHAFVCQEILQTGSKRNVARECDLEPCHEVEGLSRIGRVNILLVDDVDWNLFNKIIFELKI